MSHAMMSYDKLYLTNKEVAICKRWLEKVYSKHPIGTSKNLHKRKNTHGKYSIDWIKQPQSSSHTFRKETLQIGKPWKNTIHFLPSFQNRWTPSTHQPQPEIVLKRECGTLGIAAEVSYKHASTTFLHFLMASVLSQSWLGTGPSHLVVSRNHDAWRESAWRVSGFSPGGPTASWSYLYSKESCKLSCA